MDEVCVCDNGWTGSKCDLVSGAVELYVQYVVPLGVDPTDYAVHLEDVVAAAMGGDPSEYSITYIEQIDGGGAMYLVVYQPTSVSGNDAEDDIGEQDLAAAAEEAGGTVAWTYEPTEAVKKSASAQVTPTIVSFTAIMLSGAVVQLLH
jgi:hypothetical protein